MKKLQPHDFTKALRASPITHSSSLYNVHLFDMHPNNPKAEVKKMTTVRAQSAERANLIAVQELGGLNGGAFPVAIRLAPHQHSIRHINRELDK